MLNKTIPNQGCSLPVINLCTLVSSSLCASQLPEPVIEKINNPTYVLLGPIQHANRKNQGCMINSIVLLGAQGIVLVESAGTDEVRKHIKKSVKQLASKPITHVVNTHHHGDHYLGNSAFSDATFISSEKCRDLVLPTGDDWVKLMEELVGRKFSDTLPIAATVTYKGGTKSEVVLNGIRMVF